MLAKLATFDPKTEVTKEFKGLWQQLGVWQRTARFLSNRYLLSRWASVLVGTFYVCIYAYLAMLFSFVYYSIGRISDQRLSWLEALVDSLFIPIYVSALPKTLAFKFAGGRAMVAGYCAWLRDILELFP